MDVEKIIYDMNFDRSSIALYALAFLILGCVVFWLTGFIIPGRKK